MERGLKPVLSTEVKKFLWDVYGYGKISEFNKGLKPDGVKLRDHLSETIIGSWKTTAYRDGGMERVFIDWPRISKVKMTSEINRTDLNSGWMDFRYHLDNATFFEGYSGEAVRDFLDPKAKPILNDALFSFEKGSGRSPRWRYLIAADNFQMLVTGAVMNGGKRILIDFDTASSVTEDINQVVRAYYGKMQALPVRPVPELQHMPI